MTKSVVQRIADHVNFQGLREATYRLAELQEETLAVAQQRGRHVRALQDDGWSLQDIATELGVSKSAVAQMGAK